MGLFSSAKKLFRRRNPEQEIHGLDFNVTQWEPLLPPDVWTWGSITSANMTHEAALFQQSARLCDTLFRDDHTAGLLQTRLLSIRGLKFSFLDAADQSLVVDDPELYRDWAYMFPRSVQLEAAFWTILEGFCIGQNRWDMERRRSKLQIWHPGNCYWDKSRLCWRVYTREAGVIDLVGDLAPGKGKWVLFKTWIAERPWYGGLIRAIGLLLLIRQVALPDWLKYEKKFTGSNVLTVPGMAAEIEDVQKTIDAVAKLTTGSTINLLEGMKLEIPEPKSNAWEVFEKLLRYVDDALTILILGAVDIVQGGEHGSKARAVVQDRPRQDRLENDVDILATVSREQILYPYYVYNRGIEDLEEVPFPYWDCTPPEDAVRNAEIRSKNAAAAKAAAEAIAKLLVVYPDLDVDEFARQHQIQRRGGGAASASIVERHGRVLRRSKPEAAIPGLRAFAKAVAGARTPEELRDRVMATYTKLGPEKLAKQLAISRLEAEQQGIAGVKDKVRAQP